MEPMKNQLWTDKPHNFLGLAINFTRYIITSEKFITRKGFLNIHEDEIMLYRITDKKLALPITQRILDAAPLRCTPRTVTLLPRNSRLSGIHAPCWSFWTTPLNKPVKPIMCRGATWSAPLTGIPAVMRMNAILNNSITLPCERKGSD